MKKIFYLVSIIALLFSGCSTQSFKLLQTEEEVVKTVSDAAYDKEVKFEWKITKGDRVEINISNLISTEGGQEMNQIMEGKGDRQNLTRDGTEGHLISNDGIIRLPLVGTVSILGLTENQAAEKITKLVKVYLRDPYISVKILNQKLFVLGEVGSQGPVQITNGTMSLFEALAYSGGLTDDAQRTNIRVIRGGLRNPEVREINLADMSQLRLTSLILLPNDIVYVQPRSMKAYNIAFEEQTPFFSMLTQMMLPFITFESFRATRLIVDVAK